MRPPVKRPLVFDYSYNVNNCYICTTSKLKIECQANFTR